MKVLAIAVNTFKETIRDKILYNLLFFCPFNDWKLLFFK